MKATRRLVKLVEGDKEGGCERWAYSRHGIAHAAGCSGQTVKRAIASGDVDPQDLASVAGWVVARRARGLDPILDSRIGSSAG